MIHLCVPLHTFVYRDGITAESIGVLCMVAGLWPIVMVCRIFCWDETFVIKTVRELDMVVCIREIGVSSHYLQMSQRIDSRVTSPIVFGNAHKSVVTITHPVRVSVVARNMTPTAEPKESDAWFSFSPDSLTHN